MTYEALKKLFWPHVVLPMALVVALDYVRFVAIFAQIVASAYLVLQLVAFPVGFVMEGIGRGLELDKIRLARWLPLLGAGRRAFSYLLLEDGAGR